VVPVFGDDGDRLAIVPSKHPNDRCAALRLERYSIADSEFEHLGMCSHVIEEAKSFDDPIVEIDEFRLGKLVDVYMGHRSVGSKLAVIRPNVQVNRRAPTTRSRERERVPAHPVDRGASLAGIGALGARRTGLTRRPLSTSK